MSQLDEIERLQPLIRDKILYSTHRIINCDSLDDVNLYTEQVRNLNVVENTLEILKMRLSSEKRDS